MIQYKHLSRKIVQACLFLIIGLPALAQKKAGVINDADGYTNVREERSSNSKIVSKIFDYEVFSYAPSNSDWISIELYDGKKGYIHKSRLKEIKECDCIARGNGQLAIQKDSRTIKICGYYSRNEPKEFTVSRFFVEDCTNGKDLLNMTSCSKAGMKISSKSIEINVMARLPVRKNWEMVEVMLRKYSLNLDDSLSVFTSKSGLNPPYISAEESAAIIKSIKANPLKSAEEFHHVMRKLLVSAISGNKDAELLFRDPKANFGVILDGFMKKNIKN